MRRLVRTRGTRAADGARLAAPAALAVLVAAGIGAAGLSGCGSSQGSSAAASSSPRVSAQDRGWLRQTHQADLAEIETGPLGQDKGTTPAVRKAGAVIVSDHTAFDAKLIKVAGSARVPVPTHLSMDQTETGDRLGKETGAAFDHDFTASMMTAHEQLIAATRAEIARGQDPAVVALAKQALPMLEKHLALVRAAAASG